VASRSLDPPAKPRPTAVHFERLGLELVDQTPLERELLAAFSARGEVRFDDGAVARLDFSGGVPREERVGFLMLSIGLDRFDHWRLP
jgi:hypothetical protein